ncbi:hypothetical protein [Marinobacter nauticus]|uniref:Uncharacterized protein n=1 Tax=Marinobacter nauticus TaxID=2743 RepID=A0A1M2V0U1_MARNT|nr:hypothetical protein [Marinobacter nauticus]MEC8823486.1 hypothetical protein [Pseudomonadota bacterium]OJT01208.1 hypothetical protein BEE62_14755 [Marinobacter nauticus]
MAYESKLTIQIPDDAIKAVRSIAERVCEETGLSKKEYAPAIAKATFDELKVWSQRLDQPPPEDPKSPNAFSASASAPLCIASSNSDSVQK